MKTITRVPCILDIKGNSLDDGPGIRSVIFFKGCPLSCVWCHNPESKHAKVEISFDAKECIGCGTCMKVCTKKAIAESNEYYIDREKCDLCFDCVEACPSGALKRVGEEKDIDAVVKKVMRDKPFYDTSGGGVTVSGGEPTFHMDYLSELLQRLKEKGVHTLLETCGFFKFHEFEEKILPHVDLIYCDIKIFNSEDHKKYCGVSNEMILDNFVKLNKMYRNGGTEILPRTPLVPGITDSPENLEAIAQFLKANNVQKAELLSYNPLWREKTGKIGMDTELPASDEMQKWMNNEAVKECEAIFRENNIEV